MVYKNMMSFDREHLETPSIGERLYISPSELAGYMRHELDRDSGCLQVEFGEIDGTSPASIIFENYERQGSVAVLDAGCGTGRQLHDLLEQVQERRDINPDLLFADGVSDHDFSEVSKYADVRLANQMGRINYVVGDLKDPNLLPPNAYDLAYSYEVLIHNEDPMQIVRTILDALRPGGTMFFNAATYQERDIVFGLRSLASIGEAQFNHVNSTVPPTQQFRQSQGYEFVGRCAFKLVKAT